MSVGLLLPATTRFSLLLAALHRPLCTASTTLSVLHHNFENLAPSDGACIVL